MCTKEYMYTCTCMYTELQYMHVLYLYLESVGIR